MDYRVNTVIFFLSPLVVSINYFLKFPFVKLFMIKSGFVIGFLISLIFLIFSAEFSSKSWKLKLLFIANWILLGSYSGYSLSIGYSAYNQLNLLGYVYLLNSVISFIISGLLYYTSLKDSIKRKIPLLYQSENNENNSNIYSIFTSIILSEFLSNITAAWISLFIYTFCLIIETILELEVYYFFIVLFPAIFILIKELKRKKQAYYTQ